jgi:gamma-glutamylcyclotransferase (GGCT)/AIG2-like uncharacterized protein YtfP
MQERVFVYGTLRRGQSNHSWLAGAHWLGEASLPGAVLHDLGPFPMAVPGDGRVLGELYGVDAATLARLDRLEGHPRLYERCWLVLEDGRQAWVYLGRPRQVRFVPTLPDGRWPPGGGPISVAVVRACVWAAALLLIPPPPAPATDSLALCRAWLASHGPERVLLGNALGAAHYLTKDVRLRESEANQPVALYRSSDLQQLCRGR